MVDKLISYHMEHFVYITKFKGNEYFKIGVSGNGLKRLIDINSIWDIIQEETYIINCKSKELAYAIEEHLLEQSPNKFQRPTDKLYPENIAKLFIKDKHSGYSEIRPIKQWEDIITIAKNIKDNPIIPYWKSKILDGKLHKLKEFKKILKSDKYHKTVIIRQYEQLNESSRNHKNEQYIKIFEMNNYRKISMMSLATKRLNNEDHLVEMFNETYPNL